MANLQCVPHLPMSFQDAFAAVELLQRSSSIV